MTNTTFMNYNELKYDNNAGLFANFRMASREFMFNKAGL